MKKRLLGIGISTFFIVCCLIIGVAFASFFNKSVSQQFLDIIDNEPNYQFTPKELKEYETKIEQELVNAESRALLSEIYYALGKLDALQEEYEQSNINLLNALTLSDQLDLKLEVRIYQELATNYIKLSDTDKGYQFFEKANELVHQLNDKQAKATLYSAFAKALIFNTDHLSFPIHLMNQVSALVEDSYHQVNAQWLLSLIYKKSGLYDLALNELIKALDICITHQYSYLERYILREMSILYFMAGHYKESNETLETYFNLIDHQTAIEMVGMRLQNTYLLNGYEEVMKEIQLLEEVIVDLPVEVVERYNMAKDFALIYIDFQEQRYEESLKYLHEFEQLKQEKSNNEVMNLWLAKFRLDIDYQMGNSQTDYLEAYQTLFDEVCNLNEIRDGKFLLLEAIMDTLVSLGDYETIYQYMSMRQTVLSNELEGVSSLTDVIQNQKDNVVPTEDWDLILILTFILYSVILMVVGGLTYAFYRHIHRINVLKRLVQESKGLDPLTQTLTKEELYKQLEFECGQFKEFRFLVIDIDDFTSYNETFGYLAGDKILKEIANILKKHFPDAYISRHLGQKFIIVTEYGDDEQLRDVMTAVKKDIETNSIVTEKRVITFCMGMSKGLLMNMLDIDDQIKLASKKLNISKKRGKGICTM